MPVEFDPANRMSHRARSARRDAFSDRDSALDKGDPLQQGPTAHKTFRLIQVLRALAAELVVLRHATTLLHARDGQGVGTWLNGAAGVDIFFVISGFVMMISTTPLLTAAHPARTFFARRLERLVPMYWIATTAKVLALLAVPAIALTGLGRPWHVIASYLFFPTSSPSGAYGTVLAVGWTLVFEMAFYMLFAFVLATRLPRLAALAPILLVLAFAWKIPFVARHGTLHFYCNTMQLEFLYGIALAASLRWVSNLRVPVALLLGIAGLLPLLLWHPQALELWGGIIWGIPALALVASAIGLEPSLGRRAPRWLLEIGDASYSIYLVHGFVVPAVALLFARLAHFRHILPLALLVAIIASTVAGEIAYRLVERPITQFFKGRRHSAAPAIP